MTKTTPVTLSTPIKIDGKTISKFTLRKPKAGELRGIMLTNVLQMEVSTLIRLLPRVTQPALTEDQLADMEIDDLMLLGGKVMMFFSGEGRALVIAAP